MQTVLSKPKKKIRINQISILEHYAEGSINDGRKPRSENDVVDIIQPDNVSQKPVRSLGSIRNLCVVYFLFYM